MGSVSNHEAVACRLDGNHNWRVAVDSFRTVPFAPLVSARLHMRSVLAAAVLLAGVAPALSAGHPLTDRQEKEAEAFAANNALFFLYHEVGHFLIDQLTLPVLGKEEDAADNMATYMLLRQGTPRSNRILLDAARGWLLSGDKYDTDFDKSDFYDAHSFDHQRAYQIVCLMVGKNQKLFGDIADDYEIDEERQETCSWDYDLVERSMEGLLAPQWAAAKDAEDTFVQIVYSPVYGDWDHAAEVFKRSGALEQLAQELRQNYSIAKTVTLRARSCGGDPNAYYEEDEVEIIFCYELMDDLLQLIAGDLPPDTTSNAHIGRTGAATTD
jgi:hypothetical protein